MAALDDLIQQIKDPELRDRIQKEARFKRLDFSKGIVCQKVLAAINTDEIDHIFDEYVFF